MELFVALPGQLGHRASLFRGLEGLLGRAYLLGGVAIIEGGQKLPRLDPVARTDVHGRDGPHDPARDDARNAGLHGARRFVDVADLRGLHGRDGHSGDGRPLHLRRAGSDPVATAGQKARDHQGRERTSLPSPFHRFRHGHSFFSSGEMPRSSRIVPLSQPRLRTATRYSFCRATRPARALSSMTWASSMSTMGEKAFS